MVHGTCSSVQTPTADDSNSGFDSCKRKSDTEQRSRFPSCDPPAHFGILVHVPYGTNGSMPGAALWTFPLRAAARLGRWIAVLTPTIAPSRIGPALMRANALRALSSENSSPMNRRFRAWAITPVVPLPRNGSRTRSPSFEHARITRSRYTSGSWLSWFARRSLLFPWIRPQNGPYHTSIGSRIPGVPSFLFCVRGSKYVVARSEGSRTSSPLKVLFE